MQGVIGRAGRVTVNSVRARSGINSVVKKTPTHIPKFSQPDTKVRHFSTTVVPRTAQQTVSPQIYNPPEFTSARQVKEDREEVVARFSRIFDQMKNRPAFGHPLFKTMANLARQALTDGQAKAQFKDQFDTFSQFMLARIFLTMPSIAKTAEYALINGDYHMFATALQNLREEGADVACRNSLTFSQFSNTALWI